ncbi:MAG: hypothetical protein HY509_02285, partial [Acidobacteria bacterium]|nr:hypothetical protein [Acidobacteriota bacterium]
DLLTGLPSGAPFAAADCAAVTESVEAVELRLDPTFCNFQPLLDPNPPVVDCGAMPFFADFETDPAGVWLRSNQGVFPVYVPRDWEWTSAVPEGGTGRAFFARNPVNLGNCDPDTDDQSGLMRLQSPAITLRADQPVLTFDHYLATEAGWDGGNLKVSVNEGPWQPVAPADYLFNPYNATLNSATQGNTNPLAGQPAFTGTDGGENRGSWGQSQVGLSPYAGAGDRIRLLFDLGSDGCFGIDGWYLDNVRMCQSCAGGLGADADADGFRICDGDCDDSDSTTHAGAAERNDGGDNECPGDIGFGLVDDITGDAGFHNPADPTEYSWSPQAGAAMYQVTRSTVPNFASGCTTFETTGTVVFDAEALLPGGIFYYLVRPLLPFPGSWGRSSAGVERVLLCLP